MFYGVKELNAGYTMEFPTSKYLDSLGFKDIYREIFPNPAENRGITWTPINPKTHQDRIYYIYLKGNHLKIENSKVVNFHPIRYPSDHAAVKTTFKFKKED